MGNRRAMSSLTCSESYTMENKQFVKSNRVLRLELRSACVQRNAQLCHFVSREFPPYVVMASRTRSQMSGEWSTKHRARGVSDWSDESLSEPPSVSRMVRSQNGKRSAA